MRVLKVFLVGLLYGWFLRWIIDEIYVKDNLRLIANENMQLRERINRLSQTPSSETRTLQRTTPVPQPDQRPVPAPTTKRAQRAVRKDDLKKINGLGPAMERKLIAAGVTTFEQLARLGTRGLQNILGPSKRVTQNASDFISQAKKLAQQKSKQ